MSGGTRRAAVWALALLYSLAPAAADQNIGCLFSPSLCANGVEWCYDDFAFGKCIPIYEDEPEENSLYQYNMSTEELKSFEAVLQNLVSLGYRWEHAYTQCILQAMLYSSREHLKSVNVKICERYADPNIVSEPKGSVDSDDEVDPEEVAYVRFTPNNSPAKDSDFADEVYAPPLTDIERPPTHRFVPKELSYLEDGNLNYAEGGGGAELADKLGDVMLVRGGDAVQTDVNPLDAFRREVLAGAFDDPPPPADLLTEDYQDDEPREIIKIKKSYYPSANDLDETEGAYAELAAASGRRLGSADVPPYTTEYLTSNRFSPKEAQVLSNTMERYRERFRAKQFPFEYEEDSNDIPESRVYVDEDDNDADADIGSGQFDPYNKFPLKEELTELRPIHRGNRPMEALYAEGGPLLMDRATDLHGILSNYDWGFKRRERLDVKKPGPRLDVQALAFKYKKNVTESSQLRTTPVKKEIHDHNEFVYDPSFTYVLFKDRYTTDWKRGVEIIKKIQELLGLEEKDFSHPRVGVGEVTFKVEKNKKKMNASEVARSIDNIRDKLHDELGLSEIAAGIGDKTKSPVMVQSERQSFLSNRDNILVMLLASGVVVAVAGAALVLLIRRDALARRKLAGLASAAEIDAEATKDYQDLCRARMTGKWSGQQTGVASGAVCGGDAPQRIASLSREPDNQTPSTRSSTSSWSEEPALTNMDISTGHMVLAYMEDHLKNKDRLEQEWSALCAYEAEPCATTAAHADDNLKKNRYAEVVPYDHSRVTLNTLTNHLASDYINASTITDHDPRNPAYIAAQGPLPHTAPDFWQMVWEQGSVVMVMLTRLTENGTQQCHRYWPEEASELYHIYEVHLVSEHIWCDDYLVRSFYLKNQRTGETRTVTQFHFLSWPDGGVPASTKALLEFRRKVNKSYRGRSCPIVVHCSDGASRTGTYCLIDMVLNRMAKGAKEIDIAATLEHIRDQRPRMVSTKQQFEFVLMAVAEEVHAILKALPAQLQQQHDKKEKDAPTDKDKAN